jgi:hypothetical protein
MFLSNRIKALNTIKNELNSGIEIIVDDKENLNSLKSMLKAVPNEIVYSTVPITPQGFYFDWI